MEVTIIIEDPIVVGDSVRMVIGERIFMSGDVDAAFRAARKAVDRDLKVRDHVRANEARIVFVMELRKKWITWLVWWIILFRCNLGVSMKSVLCHIGIW